MSSKLIIQELGQRDYVSVWHEMQEFTANRDDNTLDEIWWVEHSPVYTLGVAGKEQHILDAHDIPIVRSNRGGQVTYHGPGQLVLYALLDIRRKKINIRQLVMQLENLVIDFLQQQNIESHARRDAPGVYVNDKKVAALGLRVSRGCSYHGLALNVDMDLMPFEWINPCGYEGLKATQLRDLGVSDSMYVLRSKLATIFSNSLGYAIQP